MSEPKIAITSTKAVYFGDDQGNPDKATICELRLLYLAVDFARQTISGEVVRCGLKKNVPRPDPTWKGVLDIRPQHWAEVCQFACLNGDIAWLQPAKLLELAYDRGWISPPA